MRSLLFGALLLVSGTANAAVVTWDGASGLTPDQIGLPYAAVDDGTAPTLVAGELTISTASNPTNEFYRHDAADLAFTGAHTISFRMKVDSGSTGHISRGPAAVTFTTMSGVGQSLWLDTDEAFFSDIGVRGDSDGFAAGYHDFRIEIAGLASGSAVSLFVDNVLLLSDTLFTSAADFGTAPRIAWGEFSAVAQGQSTWTFFEHDAAIAFADDIPEPTGLAIAALALAGVAGWRRMTRG